MLKLPQALGHTFRQALNRGDGSLYNCRYDDDACWPYVRMIEKTEKVVRSFYQMQYRSNRLMKIKWFIRRTVLGQINNKTYHAHSSLLLAHFSRRWISLLLLLLKYGLLLLNHHFMLLLLLVWHHALHCDWWTSGRWRFIRQLVVVPPELLLLLLHLSVELLLVCLLSVRQEGLLKHIRFQGYQGYSEKEQRIHYRDVKRCRSEIISNIKTNNGVCLCF